eukprot:TRINITY_DN8201_c0_g2_i1.p1 TRINITY_DN8201_c0_g2~~TRINITY_DN8201_c0_g2_i1.p1  ORF type:complete len:265 (-),score=74.08 TRINITY_DN8201_c0_g2_i1:35-829(-)
MPKRLRRVEPVNDGNVVFMSIQRFRIHRRLEQEAKIRETSNRDLESGFNPKRAPLPPTIVPKIIMADPITTPPLPSLPSTLPNTSSSDAPSHVVSSHPVSSKSKKSRGNPRPPPLTTPSPSPSITSAPPLMAIPINAHHLGSHPMGSHQLGSHPLGMPGSIPMQFMFFNQMMLSDPNGNHFGVPQNLGNSPAMPLNMPFPVGPNGLPMMINPMMMNHMMNMNPMMLHPIPSPKTEESTEEKQSSISLIPTSHQVGDGLESLTFK